MLSLDKPFVYYNLGHTLLNTYRFLSIHKFNNVSNTHNVFKINAITVRYISPALSDFNNITILGAFLVIKLLTGQFPYVSKYKVTSTLKM